MIAKETVDKIIETARIEDVVGDFVQLKRRGTSLTGLCPFHNEKTPSFHVSVTKGIYKCFGCGKGGDSLKFVMDHEKYSYPEALRYLASKYQIEIEEIEQSPEQLIADDRRESLYIVTAWAGKFFTETMWETDEGKNIGLSYFKERGFRDDVIKKFELGYSPESWDALTVKAVASGHKEEFLEATGLTVKNDKGKLYDRFRSRVMFPIHNFTGRVIGFGGRTLKSDKNVPKYVNSPESEIYHKSNVLYGLFFAKKAIRDEDNCFLVEGYADVLSVHQAGIENVVASSGTSLTIEQIRLIKRFTKNITVLYDGDLAGVKASIRGMSLLYKEEFKIKVVLFPDGEDPDSYAKRLGSSAFKDYINSKAVGLIEFYLNNLEPDELIDPIKRIKVTDDLAQIIANHPEPEFRSDYQKKVAHGLDIDQLRFILLVNKYLQRPKENIQETETRIFEQQKDVLPSDSIEIGDTSFLFPDEAQEKEIVRLLLNYGNQLVHWDGITDTFIAPYVITNLSDVEFEHPVSKKIIDEYKLRMEKGELPIEQDFIRHTDDGISELAISLVSSPYSLSENWYNKRKIYVRNETQNMRATILGGIFHLKKRKIERILQSIRSEIQQENDVDNQAILMQRYMRVKEVEKGISSFLGSVILK